MKKKPKNKKILREKSAKSSGKKILKEPPLTSKTFKMPLKGNCI